MTFAMFSDDALSKFRTFCGAAGLTKPPSPQGAYDQALPKAKFRFVPVPHTANTLFLRERSADLACDEAPATATELSDEAKKVLSFLKNKLSDDELRAVRECLEVEAGVPLDVQVKAEKMNAAAEARRAGAQDSRRRQLALDASEAASDANMKDFAARWPGAARIGQV